MVCWITASIAVAVVAGLLTALLWFKSSKQTFSVDLSVNKDDLFEFFQQHQNLPKVHPYICSVHNARQEENTHYFEVEENIRALGGKRFTLSIESYTDASTRKSFLRLQNHDTAVKVIISLLIGDFDPLKSLWSSSTPSSSSSSSSSSSMPPAHGDPPKTPPPSPASTISSSSLSSSPRTTVQATVEASLCGGISHVICRHMVQVWKTTLSNTEKHFGTRAVS